MSDRVQIDLKDHSKEVLEALAEKIPVALEACGLQAEGYAIDLCPADTGLLRNSITHAVSGQAPAKSSYSNDGTSRRTGKPVQQITGGYSGTVGGSSEDAVYIGSNVEYSKYIEYGTSKTSPQPFLKPAVADHVDEYKRIIETYLKR